MNPMPTKTVHGLAVHECISAMQKCIRRGLEREAMEFAVELGHTSKYIAGWVGSRLQIISHEDVGLAAPELIPLVETCVRQARAWYDPEQLGKWRMAIGTAIRASRGPPRAARATIFRRPSACGPSSKTTLRRCPTGPSTSTPAPDAARAAASTIFGDRRPSSTRPRPSPTRTRPRPTASGSSANQRKQSPPRGPDAAASPARTNATSFNE